MQRNRIYEVSITILICLCCEKSSWSNLLLQLKVKQKQKNVEVTTYIFHTCILFQRRNKQFILCNHINSNPCLYDWALIFLVLFCIPMPDVRYITTYTTWQLLAAFRSLEDIYRSVCFLSQSLLTQNGHEHMNTIY